MYHQDQYDGYSSHWSQMGYRYTSPPHPSRIPTIPPPPPLNVRPPPPPPPPVTRSRRPPQKSGRDDRRSTDYDSEGSSERDGNFGNDRLQNENHSRIMQEESKNPKALISGAPHTNDIIKSTKLSVIPKKIISDNAQSVTDSDADVIPLNTYKSPLESCHQNVQTEHYPQISKPVTKRKKPCKYFLFLVLESTWIALGDAIFGFHDTRK